MEKVVEVPKVNPVPATPSVVQSVPSVLRKFDTPKKTKKLKIFAPILLGIVMILAGVGTGKLLASRGQSSTAGPTGVAVGDEKMGADKEVGIADEETFKDTAEGVLREGGIGGEGTHHLDRDMGESKYVYLTSTAINLQSFVGKKVKVWGQTIAGQKAGWLMDVGKVKILE